MRKNEAYEKFVQLVAARMSAAVVEARNVAEGCFQGAIELRDDIPEQEKTSPDAQEAIAFQVAVILLIADYLREMAARFQRVGEVTAVSLVEPLEEVEKGYAEVMPQIVKRFGVRMFDDLLMDQAIAKEEYLTAYEQVTNRLLKKIRQKWHKEAATEVESSAKEQPEEIDDTPVISRWVGQNGRE